MDVLPTMVVVLCAACTYAVAGAYLLKFLFSQNSTRIHLKTGLYGVGFFVALVLGCLILGDMIGGYSPALYAVTVTFVLLLSFRFFERALESQEARQKDHIDDLENTIEKLLSQVGKPQTVEDVCSKAARQYDLTRREEEILVLLLQDKTYSEMAEELFLSHNTVKSHVRNLYRKMNVNQKESLFEKLEEA